MSDNLPDWYSARPEHGWASRAGLARLRGLVEPLLPFVPSDEQVGLSAQVMDGSHSLIIRATGSGKTMIIVIPLLARPATLALVISPLNMLERNMVRTFASFQLPSVAINRQTLRAAVKEHRNLWDEAASLSCRALFVGPELLSSDDFDQWIRAPRVRMRLALSATDEAHVIDLWAEDFRVAYKSVPALRAQLPPWVTFFGLTATCRPGLQTSAVIQGLGFQPDECVVHRGDCERHDLHIIVRPILYGVSGTIFPDLDWLVPESVSAELLCDKKTLVYCNSIQLGHAVTCYLRSLLPPELAPMQYRLIRHIHSLSCDACKQEALDSLCDVPDAPPCAIEVATDVVGFGVDARRVQRVVCFDIPDELNTLLQRIGRTGRDSLPTPPTAYIYLKQSTMIDALRSELIDDGLPPADVPVLRALHDRVYEVDKSKTAPADDPEEAAVQRIIRALQKASALPKKHVEPDDRSRAIIAFVQASMHVYCITLRCNQLYGNPGDTPCRRCSTCVEDLRPPARRLDAHGAEPGHLIRRPRACMGKDLVAQATNELTTWRRAQWLQESDPSTFLDSSSFLVDELVKAIAASLLKISTEEILRRTTEGWVRWPTHGRSLWLFVSQLRDKYATLSDNTAKAKETERQTRKRRAHESSSSDKENDPPAPKRICPPRATKQMHPKMYT